MTIQTTDITTSIVANTLGFASNDIGKLCTSNKINPFSIYKPVIYQADTIPSESRLSITGFRKTLPGTTGTACEISYCPPGTISPIYCRLGDFRGYNHDALKPLFEPATSNYETEILIDSGRVITINGINAKNLSYLKNIGQELSLNYFAIIRNSDTLVRCASLTNLTIATFEDVLGDAFFKTSWQSVTTTYKFYLTSVDNTSMQSNITLTDLTNYYLVNTEGNLHVNKTYVRQDGTNGSVRNITSNLLFGEEIPDTYSYITTHNYINGKTVFKLYISFINDPSTELHDKLLNLNWNDSMPVGGINVDRFKIVQNNNGSTTLSIHSIQFDEFSEHLQVTETTSYLPNCYCYKVTLNDPISFTQVNGDLNVGILTIAFKGANMI